MSQFPKFWNQYTDKVLHFAAGFVIYIMSWGILNRFLSGSWWVVAISLAVVFIVAVIKETRDMLKAMNGNNFDLYDIVATEAGGIFAAIAIPILQSLN